MRSTFNHGETVGTTGWRAVAARAVSAVANTAQNVATPFVTWRTYDYTPYTYPMGHTGKDATSCSDG